MLGLAKTLFNTLIACLVCSALTGVLVYFKQSNMLKEQAHQHKNELKSIKAEYVRNMTEMESYLNSLSSRVKHLSLDNRRLTATGYKLSQKLENNVEEEKSHDQKTNEAKKLHLELSNLDQHIIEKYENFIAQQKVFTQLSLECNNGRNKSEKCNGFNSASDAIESMATQIKFLNTKREILLSQIARAEAL